MLGEEDIDIGRSILYLSVRLTRELSEDEREDDHEGNEAKHHQREHIVEHEHSRKHANDDKAVLEQIYDDIRKCDRDRVGVVGDSCYERSDGNFVELIVRERRDMLVEILTHVRNYALTGLLQDYRLDIGADERDEKDRYVENDRVEEVRELKAFFFSDSLDEVTHNKRGDDLVRDRDDHKQENDDKALGVGLSVDQQTLDDLAVLHISIEADSFLFVLHKHVCENEDRSEYADDGAEYQKRI